MASSGNHVYVAWLQAAYGINEEHVVVAASHDGGRTFSQPVMAGRPTGHGAWDVSLAADGENVFVGWSDDRNRLWTAGSRDAGRTFPCQAVITAPGNPTEGGSYDLAVDGPRVHWVWLGDDFDVYTRRSTDAGRTIGQVQHVRDGSPADFIGAPNIDADGGVVAITTSQMYRMPRADKTGTDFGHQPVLTTSQDGGDTWAEQNIGSPSDRCIGDYCSAQVSPPSWEVVRTGWWPKSVPVLSARGIRYIWLVVIATTPPSASMFGEPMKSAGLPARTCWTWPIVRPASVERRV